MNIFVNYEQFHVKSFSTKEQKTRKKWRKLEEKGR